VRLLAGLILAQMGLKPIIIERGKAVRERTKDTWALWRKSVLTPESNVQFGEGGAGTFSDGKLYSRIKDPRHLGRKVLVEFVKAGAPDDILTEAHPHIGTFRLVTMVMSMRETIEKLGGEYRFGTRVDDFAVETDAQGERRLAGLHLSNGEYLPARRVIMAVGHSARDTFEVLYNRGVHIEAKPFAIGVRIEHPQSLIDQARLAPAPSIRSWAGGLCPGAPVQQRPLGLQLLHVSGRARGRRRQRGRPRRHQRDEPVFRAEFNANSGLVVDITPERDFPGHPLAGIALQRHWEERAFVAGGSNYQAPGQKVGDFLARRPSTEFGSIVPSYQPGVHLTELETCLPDFVTDALREALPVFGRQMAGYDHPDVVMTGVETRTSSPVRITRGKDLQSLNTRGLYPAGEGAGYAGDSFGRRRWHSGGRSARGRASRGLIRGPDRPFRHRQRAVVKKLEGRIPMQSWIGIVPVEISAIMANCANS
jgi:uncharacterized FAD-dependent dehydrogenase